jgi:hypothetical protein
VTLDVPGGERAVTQRLIVVPPALSDAARAAWRAAGLRPPRQPVHAAQRPQLGHRRSVRPRPAGRVGGRHRRGVRRHQPAARARQSRRPDQPVQPAEPPVPQCPLSRCHRGARMG